MTEEERQAALEALEKARLELVLAPKRVRNRDEEVERFDPTEAQKAIDQAEIGLRPRIKARPVFS